MQEKTIDHIGIIMDGNGRWAQRRGKNRSAGHKEGLATAKRIVKACADEGVAFLTLYTFSTENWKRSEEEVSFLMNLIRNSLKREYRFYRENKIRVLHSGDLSILPPDIRAEIQDVEEQTEGFDGMAVNLAINYGGRDEILRAMRNAWAAGVDPTDLSEERIHAYLDQPQLPDLDLVIRSGGERRLSNFMLWRSSYAEIYFSESLWPDFSEKELRDILSWYRGRSRRYGGVLSAV